MNQDKNKIVVLLILFGVLAGAAAFVFLRPKHNLAGKARKTDSAPAVVAAGALPSREELTELADWLAEDSLQLTAENCPNEGVLGLDGALPPEPEQEEAKLAVPTVVAFVEPPRLEGVISDGRRRTALFGGEAYQRGQQIVNTVFIVVHIGSSTVKLRSQDGQEMEINLLN